MDDAAAAQLVGVLLDKNARWDERDDAAMDLGDADSEEAVRALLLVGSDATEDETLLASVGAALAEVFARNPQHRAHDMTQLAAAALKEFRDGNEAHTRKG